MKKIILFISILAILGLMVACGLSPIITSSSTEQLPEEMEPEVSVEQPDDQQPEPQADLPAESVFGPGTFSLDLPEGWDVFGPETMQDDSGRSYQVFLTAPDQGYLEGPGASKVIVANAIEWTPEDIAFSQCSTCPDNGFEEVTLGGQPALRTQIGGGGVPFMVTVYFVENDGNLIAIDIHDPETMEPLMDVIESIQLQ